MSKSTTLVYDPETGTFKAIFYDEFAPVFKSAGMKDMSSVSRASNVEPSADGWNVDMTPVGGPERLSQHDTRQQALDAEVAWLSKNM